MQKKLFEGVRWEVSSSGTLKEPGKSSAIVKVVKDGREVHEAAEGVGPVDALFNALFKVTKAIYPKAHDVQIIDYRVSYEDGCGKGAAGKVRVNIKLKRNGTEGHYTEVSENILEASFQALVKGFCRLL